MSEVYKSTTHGEIPLSFEGRRLMQNLRVAVIAAIDVRNWHNNDNAVSKARGELAKYMSNLEERNERFKRQLNLQFNTPTSFRLPPMPTDFTAVFEDKTKPNPIIGTTHYNIHLPPIPEGYELHIVGSLVSMSPIKKEAAELKM